MTRLRIFLLVAVALTFATACAPFQSGGGVGSPASESLTLSQEGARIWSMACGACHNLRTPPEYAAEQWPVIINHMRTRAVLTRSEAEAVTAFLQEMSGGSD